MDPEQTVWIILMIFFIVILYLAYNSKVAEHGHKKTSVPGAIHFAYLVLSSCQNLYIAIELFSNTKLDNNYDSNQNVECTIGFHRKQPVFIEHFVRNYKIEVTDSKVQSVESAMLLFYFSKFLRLLDSFTLLSRETDKVFYHIVSTKVNIYLHSFICVYVTVSGSCHNIRRSSSHGDGKYECCINLESEKNPFRSMINLIFQSRPNFICNNTL